VNGELRENERWEMSEKNERGPVFEIQCNRGPEFEIHPLFNSPGMKQTNIQHNSVYNM
jgi:hypothetical protein